jgi:riboflavin biosynthesis pyrimidine reductase
VRRLLPDAAETSVDEQLAQLDFVSQAHEERPYLYTNFVVSLDGRATLGGRSGPLGSETDTAILVGLRLLADAVLIGAGTMRTERYGRVVGDPDKRAVREQRGLADDPLMVLVSNSLELPWDAELFTCGHGRVLIFTAGERDVPQTATPVEIERHRGSVDLTEAMRFLRRERDVRALLCEGGPHVHAQLIEAGLADELFVTHAPKLAGGEGPHLVDGLPERERTLELAWLLEENGELYARYRARG